MPVYRYFFEAGDFWPYLIFAVSIALFSASVPTLVAITGIEEASTPYVIHNTAAVTSSVNMRSDRSSTFLVFQAFITCGV